MKFGIVPGYGMAPVEEGGFAAASARLIEEMGFESIWTIEHVVVPAEYASRYPYDASGRMPVENVAMPDPLVWLAYVAAATTRIRLGTGVLILPQRNPVLLAKELASLDRLSGGRLLLGIGLGWLREESEALGIPFERRGARTREAVEAMRALWRDDEASYAGEHVAFERVRCSPRPANPAGVPIHVGGHTDAAARRAGTLGDGFFPFGVAPERLRALLEIVARAADAAGRDAAEIEVTCVAPAELQAVEALVAEGADRIAIFAPAADLDSLGDFLVDLRERVIDPLGG